MRVLALLRLSLPQFLQRGRIAIDSPPPARGGFGPLHKGGQSPYFNYSILKEDERCRSLFLSLLFCWPWLPLTVWRRRKPKTQAAPLRFQAAALGFSNSTIACLLMGTSCRWKRRRGSSILLLGTSAKATASAMSPLASNISITVTVGLAAGISGSRR